MPEEDKKDATSTLQSIKDGVGNLLHLTVLTVVGDVALTPDQSRLADSSLEGTRKIFSRIGLLDGDIQTVLSEDFVTNEAYVPLRDFHKDMVSQGNEIVRNNVQALKELVSLLKNELGAKEEAK